MNTRFSMVHDTYLRDVYLLDPITRRYENVHKCCVNGALTQQGFQICDVIFPILTPLVYFTPTVCIFILIDIYIFYIILICRIWACSLLGLK